MRYFESKHVSLAYILAFVLIATLPLGNSALAQNSTEGDPDEDEKRTHYSLYYEDFRNENYERVLPNLRWILTHAPAFPGDDARNFRRMVETFENLAERAEDEEQKRAYIDSALVYTDRAIPELQEIGAEVDEYSWHLRRGRIVQTHSDLLPNWREESIEAYRQAYEHGPDRIEIYYIERLVRNYLREDMREQAIAFMDDLEQHRGDDEEVVEFLDEWRDRVFTSPEERIAFLEGRLERDEDDLETMTELFDLYIRYDHDDEASRLAERLLELDPTPRVYRLIGRMRMDDGEHERAYELYSEAAELEEEPSAETYYNMGLAHQQMDNLSRARSYYREALDVDSDFGRAYMAIGDIYARTVNQCSGAQLEREDRAVYWLVTDYYQRAKNADPSLENQADQMISTYRQYYPNQEALFFRGWEVGSSFSINYGCYSWINESTTVKAPS